MDQNIPPQVPNAFRIAISLDQPEPRLDNILLNALREQTEHPTLKIISRGALKKLFAEKKIMIKGQNARPASSLARGTTYVDILGY